MKYNFDVKEPMKVENVLGINVSEITTQINKALFNILQVAALKQVTRTWRQPNQLLLSY